MKRTAVCALLAILTGCERKADSVPPVETAGATLERAAITAGVVADPAAIDPVGVFGIEGDRVCVVPRDGGYRIGATADYGEGQACAARGTATGRARLAIDFGADCRFDAIFDGERMTFPAVIPAACDRLCTGRASLAAIRVPRLSTAVAEASTLRASDGTSLCTG